MLHNVYWGLGLFALFVTLATWGDSHINVTGILVGKFKLNPLGDQCGCGSGLN